MAKLLKLRRGTTTQHGSFTGAEGEVTIDTTKDTAVVHDGAQAGGRPLAREDMNNVSSASIVGQITASALAGTKVQPNFGTQDIETTGNVDLSDSTGAGNNRIKLGTGDDFQIYHSSTQNYLVSSNGNIELRHTVGGANEAMFKAMPNAQTELYYDGSRKLHTRADAVNIIGDIDMTDADNYKINIGAGSDLQLYHNGTNSFISNTTGILQIDSDDRVQVNATEFRIKNAADTETIAKFIQDGACQLYHNNVLRLNTNSNGTRFIGMLAGIDNDTIALGTSNDLQIYHDGTHSFLVDTGTGELRIGSNSGIRLTKHDSETVAFFDPDGACELYHDNAKKFETYSDGIKVHSSNAVLELKSLNTGTSTAFAVFSGYRTVADVGRLGEMQFINQRDGDIQAQIEVIANGDTNAYFDFITNNAGTRTLRVDHAGANFPDSIKARFGNSEDLQIYHESGYNIINTNTAGNLDIKNGSEYVARFAPNGNNELYYDNSKKLHTNSGGIYVTGNIELPDNGELKLGASGDVNIYHNSSLGNSWITNATGVLNIRSNGFAIRAQGDSASYINITDDAEVNLYYNNSKKFETTNTGVSVTGDMVASGNVTAYSDAKLKTEISSIDNALDIVGKLRGVNYKWLSNGQADIGVIAQEVETVVPEVVKETEDGTKTVDYGRLVSILINAVNELKEEIGGK